MKSIFIVIALLIGLIFLILRFSNPELTETQLAIKYWYLLVISVIAMICYHKFKK